jgi:hypothetical protein
MRPTMKLTRSFSDLADQLERELERQPEVRVRIVCADGSSLEADVLEVATTDLLLRSSAGKQIEISADDLRAVDVLRPRRGREWFLAACFIPGATAFLVAYAQLPWVRAVEGHILIGFVILVAMLYGLVSLPILRTRLESWLTHWQRLYSTAAPGEQS